MVAGGEAGDSPRRRDDIGGNAFPQAPRLSLCAEFACYICTIRGRNSEETRVHNAVRLPPKLRSRLQSLARQSGRSAHSLIIEAVRKTRRLRGQMRSLVKEAMAADADIELTGEVYRAEDVHAWMGAPRKGCLNG